ncbi:PREDICTED: signal transducer and activator of transcription 1-like isoform X2 [Poecilia mexicana]|uniref:signal transducer and activator of transcription 1-like isoform X2 n=1 Tax=Poecilia mexicana TaxID=48701 RepID=UPI00072D9537|nr:PREDICTED: signal transducer and activator of transcription 1-like isoform X2 [Poecilia mexicana]
MAQWQELLKLDSALQNRVRQLYDGRFPTEIRNQLSHWIESQDWSSAAVNENAAAACFCALLQHLEEQWHRSVQENSILQGPDFPRMRAYIVENFQAQPLNLAAILSECLKEEKQILESVTMTMGGSPVVMAPQWTELDNRVMQLKLQLLELKKEVKVLEDLSEKLDFIRNSWQSKVEQKVELVQSKALVEQECLKMARSISQTKQVVLQRLVSVLNEAAGSVQTLTGVELPQWRRRQQRSCIGSPEDAGLDLLEKWFTAVAEVLLGVGEQLQQLQVQNQRFPTPDFPGLTDSMAEMEKFSRRLTRNLLTSALVVEKQPVMQNLPQRPLILKTGVRFKVTVRFLVNLPAFKTLIKVKPVFDKDVEEVKTISGFRQFDFSRDDAKVLDVDLSSGALTAAFEHLSLKEKKSRVKGSCESQLTVTEELHIIRFVTQLQHNGETFHIQASSLPLVVVSSSNQVPSAWAAIMWSNMASGADSENLSLFLDPPGLTWQQLAPLLSWQFLSVGQRPLDQDQLSMLQAKIMGDPGDPDGLIHWNKFSKDESVWIWIDGILDLIKKFVWELWRDGCIMGFVSKERTRSLLREKPVGTFLIRFSESILDGAITFSWVEQSAGGKRIHAVEPYTKKELSVLSLPNAIYNYTLATSGRSHNPLVYLYPDTPKDAAFARYRAAEPSPPSKNTKHYIPWEIAPFSIDPTPPPSPPMPAIDMELEDLEDPEEMPLNDILQDLFSDLPDLSHLPLESCSEPGFFNQFIISQ